MSQAIDSEIRSLSLLGHIQIHPPLVVSESYDLITAQGSKWNELGVERIPVLFLEPKLEPTAVNG